MTTASANKQLKQCSGQAPLHTYEKSIACVCWLCLHRMLLEREGGGGKIHNSLFSMAVQITINVKKKKHRGAGIIWWCNTNWALIEMWRTLIIPLWHGMGQRMEDEWRSCCQGTSGRVLGRGTRSLVPLLRFSARQVSVTCSLTVSGASLAGRFWEFMARSTTTVTVLLAFWEW